MCSKITSCSLLALSSAQKQTTAISAPLWKRTKETGAETCATKCPVTTHVNKR